MCITFVCTRRVGRWRLLLANNRDELLDRPTLPLQWSDGILGGIDEQAGGTWLGIDKRGRVANLLSITEPQHAKNPNAPSRGVLPHDFLKSSLTGADFCKQLTPNAAAYNGFQLLTLDRASSSDDYFMTSLVSRYVDAIEPRFWQTGGVHVLSNSPPEKPLGKTRRGQSLFDQFISDLVPQAEETSNQQVIDGLLRILNDRQQAQPDPQLELQTGTNPDLHAPLAAINVFFPDYFRYGTRSQSIILVDDQGEVTYFERRMATAPPQLENATWEEKTIKFNIDGASCKA